MENIKNNADGAIKQYQSTIQRYKLALKVLSDMSRSLEIEMLKMESSMQPVVLARGVSKIPDELLAAILCSVFEPWDTEHGRFKPRPEELRLVCKRFKHIVDTQPSLRCYLDSTMTGGEAERCLTRSGTVGLKIHLDNGQPHFAPFVDAVLPQAHRWQEIHFDYRHSSGPKVMQAYQKLKNLNLPLLQKLVLRNSTKRNAAESIYSTWTTPNLTRVVFHGETPRKFAGKTNLLECELVDDEGGDEVPKYIPHLSAFLSASTSLTSLRLTVRDAILENSHYDGVEGVHMPNLRIFQAFLSFPSFDMMEDEMDTVDDYGNAIYSFISSLRAPRLEHVAVTVENEEVWADITGDFLINLVESQGKNKSLRRLEFTQMDTRIEIHDFKIFSNLKHDGCAVLTGLSIKDKAARDTSAESSTPHCRFLRKLHLKDCSLSVGALRGLLRIFTNSRIYPKFENLVLTRCAGFKKETLRGLVGSEYISFEDD